MNVIRGFQSSVGLAAFIARQEAVIRQPAMLVSAQAAVTERLAFLRNVADERAAVSEAERVLALQRGVESSQSISVQFHVPAHIKVFLTDTIGLAVRVAKIGATRPGKHAAAYESAYGHAISYSVIGRHALSVVVVGQHGVTATPINSHAVLAEPVSVHSVRFVDG